MSILPACNPYLLNHARPQQPVAAVAAAGTGRALSPRNHWTISPADTKRRRQIDRLHLFIYLAEYVCAGRLETVSLRRLYRRVGTDTAKTGPDGLKNNA